VNCPVCNSTELSLFLRRARVPVHQNMVFREQRAAVTIERGNLELAVCSECGFVFNTAFEPAKVRYGPDYDNTQVCSPFFENYVDALVTYLLTEKGLHDSTIVEVGCGKGYFLRKLVEDEKANNTGYGFDPSYVGPEVDCGGRLHFEKRFYDSASASIPADVVICRHVIEHVPRPIPLLRSIRQALAHAAAPKVFFETPCVEWILRNQVVWDFFYEHCSYFSADSLSVAMQQAGFQVQNVQHVFGDQYLWLEATIGTNTPGGKPTRASEVAVLCQNFGTMESDLVIQWRANLRELTESGPVALWGGAKGVTLANLVDPERELVACVVDLNPQKQGGFLPGTGHPIVNYLDLPLFQVKSAIQMNPNYAAENLALLHEAQLEVTLIDPINWRVIQ